MPAERIEQHTDAEADADDDGSRRRGTSGTGASLRRLSTVDLGDYKALRDQVLRTYPSAFTSDAESEIRKPADAYLPRIGTPPLDDGRFTIGAWQAPPGGSTNDPAWLVGAISCERDGRRQVAHIGHLVGMMVLPQAQGRGIGRALLAACIEAVRLADGIEQLTLSVTADNAAAVALYGNAGFTRYGTLPRAIKLRETHPATYHAKDLMVLDLRPANGPRPAAANATVAARPPIDG